MPVFVENLKPMRVSAWWLLYFLSTLVFVCFFVMQRGHLVSDVKLRNAREIPHDMQTKYIYLLILWKMSFNDLAASSGLTIFVIIH